MALPVYRPVLFRIPNGSGGTDEVTVDACVTENHTLANTLTDHPVEQGANITDHSRPEPRRVSLDCIVSNSPIKGHPLEEGVEGSDWAFQFWQRLVKLHLSPKLIEVSTIRDFYDSMGVENVTSAVDVKSANALRFTIGIKQVRVVQNKFTRVVKAADTRPHPVKKQGAASTTKLSADERNVSAVYRVSGFTVQK